MLIHYFKVGEKYFASEFDNETRTWNLRRQVQPYGYLRDVVSDEHISFDTLEAAKETAANIAHLS